MLQKEKTLRQSETKDPEQTEEQKYHAVTQSKKNRDFPEENERSEGEEYLRPYDIYLNHTKSPCKDLWNRAEKNILNSIQYEDICKNT